MNTVQNNALIINLTRFGDLIQSQPVLAKLKEQDLTTHLVCLENFAHAAGLLEHVDYTHPFPGAKFLARLDSHWPSAVAEFQAWIKKLITNTNFDLTINLTPSLSSRLLNSQFQSKENRGFYLDEMGFGCYSGNWAAFLQASSAHRGCSPFNIVDLFVHSAHLPATATKPRIKRPEQDEIAAIQKMLYQESNNRGFNGFVGFQLGASQDQRRWPVEYFARLGEMLVQRLNLCPVILGSKAEKKLAQKYLSTSQAPCVDLTGRTSLKELSAALSCCSLLITNDTGTMHLAAGLNIKCVAFFLATAQPWDTGPYLENCLCLEPDMDCHPCSFSHKCQTNFSCRSSFSPKLVFQTVEFFNQHKKWPQINTDEARMRVTDFNNGFYTLRPVNDAARNNYSQWMLAQNHYYRLFLDHGEITLPNLPFISDRSFCRDITEHLEQIIPLLKLAGEQARVLKKAPLPGVKKKFLSTWQRLSHQLSQSPHLPVLGLLWTYQSQEPSLDLNGITDLCSRYMHLIEAMRDFLSQK
ncbi:MAG: glycosyltransferase family 9 protein [Desulfonatronovibrio sp. MSAO_Bac4]|nr:MAG: glycosyltransferase family 9 protein [Desulfonatronovibrio sp. MSAO_Bac4]